MNWFTRLFKKDQKKQSYDALLSQPMPISTAAFDYDPNLYDIAVRSHIGHPSPWEVVPLVKLQFLADAMVDAIPWLCPVYLELIDYNDRARVAEVINKHIMDHNTKTVATACLSMDMSDDFETIIGQSRIYIFHPTAVTVGMLLHLLASFSKPYCGEREDWKKWHDAYEHLQLQWELFFSKYGII